MAAVMQGVDTNFHIDILRPLVEAAARSVRHESTIRKATTAAGCGASPITFALARFAIHEEVVPGPKKQGYVIKRLLRRAVLDGHQMGVHEPFLHKLVGTVAERDEASRIPN